MNTKYMLLVKRATSIPLSPTRVGGPCYAKQLIPRLWQLIPLMEWIANQHQEGILKGWPSDNLYLGWCGDRGISGI